MARDYRARLLDTEEYLAALRRDREGIAAAAARGLDLPVPSCPGWTMSTLLAHVGGAYAYVAKTVQARHPQDVVQGLEDLGLPADIERWFRQERSPGTMPPGLVRWFRDIGAQLERIFRQTDPSSRAWTWWQPDQTAGFWVRRMAHETAVHRWDAEAATDSPHPIEPELARDGIDEALDVYLPRWCRPKSDLLGRGEAFRLERTDGEAAWTLRFEGEGMAVWRNGEPADVVLRGPASNLLLFLWRRILPDRLEVDGDLSLLGRFGDLVPPD